MNRHSLLTYASLAALAVFLIASSGAHASLVGYWDFEGDVLDGSGNGNNGTRVGPNGLPAFVGDTPTVLTASTQSLSFDGVDDYVDVAQTVNLPIATQDAFTISMWVKGASQADKRIFSEGNDAPSGPLFNKPLYNLGTGNTAAVGSKVDLFVRNDANVQTAPHLKSQNDAFDGTWNHVAIVDDHGQASVYIDGELDPTPFNYPRSTLTLNTTTFGGILRAAACCHFAGNIDDAAIWNTVLDATSIYQLSQGVAPTAITGPGPGESFLIDIDSQWIGGGDSSGPISTEPGWTSLDATTPANANGASVTVDGIAFSIGSADGSRIRLSGGNPNPNPLTGDFVYDDGPGEALILFFGGAGSLKEGPWQVDVYIHDETSGPGQQIVGYRDDGAETIVSSTVMPHADGPAIRFQFESDGVSAYDVFVRENSTLNRTRLNAVRLTYVPEPSALLLAVFGLMGLALCARRRR